MESSGEVFLYEDIKVSKRFEKQNSSAIGKKGPSKKRTDPHSPELKYCSLSLEKREREQKKNQEKRKGKEVKEIIIAFSDLEDAVFRNIGNERAFFQDDEDYEPIVFEACPCFNDCNLKEKDAVFCYCEDCSIKRSNCTIHSY
jgi:hypothetical protein